jgi:ATP-dependent exoDNAse (exonuclease V) beta subunit
MTRAKERLVVSGGWRDGPVELSPFKPPSFADLVSQRVDREALAEQVAGGSGVRADGVAQWVVPALRAGVDDRAERSTRLRWEPPPPGVVRDDAERVAVARRTAADRMAAVLYRSASAEAHERLQQAESEEAEPPGEGTTDRDRAMAAGTLIHGLLEHLDLERDLVSQVRATGESEVAGELLRRLAEGRCLARLGELGPRVVARELPVLVWEETTDGPGVVVSGFIDLVYRDPVDERLVVADYKTDRVTGGGLGERAAVYEPQIRTYARALREALTIDDDPRCELWFLYADEIVRL